MAAARGANNADGFGVHFAEEFMAKLLDVNREVATWSRHRREWVEGECSTCPSKLPVDIVEKCDTRVRCMLICDACFHWAPHGKPKYDAAYVRRDWSEGHCCVCLEEVEKERLERFSTKCHNNLPCARCESERCTSGHMLQGNDRRDCSACRISVMHLEVPPYLTYRSM